MTMALMLHRASGAPLSTSFRRAVPLVLGSGAGAVIGWESSDHMAKFYVTQSVQA